jgi:hypothetical protein
VSSFSLILYDETGKATGALEAAIRNAKDWKAFWAGKGGPISTLWADSRKVMFATEGKSTGADWPKYTPLEQRWWVPIKRWSLGVKRIEQGGILRWTPTPKSATPAAHERLYPSMTVTNHPNYVYKVSGTSVQLGTSLEYARNHNLGVGAYVRKVSTGSVERAIARGNKAAAVADASTDLKTVRGARKRLSGAIKDSKRKLAAARKGSVSVPTPKRPLVRFGRPFADGVQKELNRTAMMQSAGKKVGITTDGLADRINFARAQGRP